jgi:ligand-binding SRPBCC domain-containing protein
VWEPNVRFVDEQIKGPYALWVHEHTFAPAPGDPAKTLVRDRVRYAHAGWMVEPLVHSWFVRPRLEEIFAYRAEATRRLIERG